MLGFGYACLGLYIVYFRGLALLGLHDWYYMSLDGLPHFWFGHTYIHYKAFRNIGLYRVYIDLANKTNLKIDLLKLSIPGIEIHQG